MSVAQKDVQQHWVGGWMDGWMINLSINHPTDYSYRFFILQIIFLKHCHDGGCLNPFLTKEKGRKGIECVSLWRGETAPFQWWPWLFLSSLIYTFISFLPDHGQYQ